MPKAERQDTGSNGSKTVRAVPCSDTDRLLSSAEPLRCDDAKKWQTAAFEEAQEETSCEKSTIIMASSHARLCDSPSEHQ